MHTVHASCVNVPLRVRRGNFSRKDVQAMDLSALRRAYTDHVPTLMGARGGSAVLVPLVDTAGMDTGWR